MQIFDYQQRAFYYQQEKKHQLKDLSRVSNAAGLSGLLFFIFSFIAAFIAILAAAMLNSHYSSEAVEQFCINLDYILGTLIPLPVTFFIFAKINKMRVRDSLPLEFKNKNNIMLTIGMAFALIMISRLIVALFSVVLNFFNYDVSAPELAEPNGIGETIVLATVVTLMTGLIEEFAYRGIMLTALRKYGDTFAVIASSFIFSIMHRNPISILNAFLLGVIMGYAVIITNSLWTSIIIHTLNNFQSIIYLIFPENTALILILVISGVMAAIGITAVIIVAIYRKDIKSHIHLNKNRLLPLGNKIIRFYFAPMVLILIAVICFFDPIEYWIAQFIRGLVSVIL